MDIAPKILLPNNRSFDGLVSTSRWPHFPPALRDQWMNRIFMALGLALTGLTHETKGKILWTMKTVSWWDELELTKDRRFKKLDLGPDKLVYEALLTVEEVWMLHKKYQKKFLSVFEDDPLENPYRQKRIQLVDALENQLKNPDLRFVNAWIFDWDY